MSMRTRRLLGPKKKTRRLLLELDVFIHLTLRDCPIGNDHFPIEK